MTIASSSTRALDPFRAIAALSTLSGGYSVEGGISQSGIGEETTVAGFERVSPRINRFGGRGQGSGRLFWVDAVGAGSCAGNAEDEARRTCGQVFQADITVVFPCQAPGGRQSQAATTARGPAGKERVEQV